MGVAGRLEALVQRTARGRNVHEVVLVLNCADADHTATTGTWRDAPVTADTPFALASVSKLLGTAMALRLVSDGVLALDAPVAEHFPPGALDGLHHWRGRDLSGTITLRHLLSHTSGLPDYFEGKRRDGSRMVMPLLAGQDRAYDVNNVLTWARDEMRPHFAPGEGGRALYSDTNFQLLGAVIASASALPLPQALARFVTDPLGLKRTRFYDAGFTSGADSLPLRHRGQVLDLPRALSSMPLDGGAVSTGRELLAFVRAFFAGGLFDRALLAQMHDWRPVFFPIQAGLGVHRFALPRWLSPFRAAPVLIGHSGISGAFAFVCLERNIALAGTVNQIADRGLPFRLMLRALDIVRRFG